MKEKRIGRVLLTEYSVSQALYFMGHCCVNSYAALFLQGRGYSNSIIGLILALGNLAGFFLAPVLATFIDRGRKITVYHCLYAMLAVEGAIEILLIFNSQSNGAISAAYILMVACVVASAPLNTALCFDIDRSSKYVNYGFARGMGSLGFAMLTLCLGRLCTRRSPEVVPFIGTVMVLSQMVMLAVILYNKRKYGTAETVSTYTENKYASSMRAFIRKNLRFCIMCFGSGLVMFASGILSSFTINIVRSVGGNAQNMGVYSAISAIVEIPMMALYSRLIRHVRCSRTIQIGAIAYVFRIYVFTRISNVTGLYLTSLTEIFSYAMLIPALVEYANTVIGYEDMAKGQTISAAMMTMGTILASQIGGIMMDCLTVKQTLNVTLAICAVGALVCYVAVDTKRA